MPYFYRDSASYWDAGIRLFHDRIDMFRTPVYPLYLKGIISLDLDGIMPLHVCTVVQWAAFLGSVPLFFSIARKIWPRHVGWAWAATLLYGMHPGILLWTRTVLTEPFALTGSVLLVWLLMSGGRRNAWKLLIAAYVLAAVLLLLRPSLIWLLPVLWCRGLLRVFRFRRCRKRRRSLTTEIAGCLAVTAAWTIYASTYWCHYGIFAVSDVALLNVYINRRAMPPDVPYPAVPKAIRDDVVFFASAPVGAYYDRLEGIEFPHLDKRKFRAEGKKDRDLEFLYLASHYGLPAIRDYLAADARLSPGAWVAAWRRRCADGMCSPLFVPAAFTASRRLAAIAGYWFSLLNCRIWLVTGMLPIQLILLGILFFRSGHISESGGMLFLAECGSLAVTALGATGEWPRLMLPTVPLYLLGVIWSLRQFADLLRRNKNGIEDGRHAS